MSRTPTSVLWRWHRRTPCSPPADYRPQALLDADAFEDLPGQWQAAILKAEENRPDLRIVGGD